VANLPEDTLEGGAVLRAYLFILKEFYGRDLDLDYPLVFSARDRDTGLERHFKINFNSEFLRVRRRGPLKEITDAECEKLRSNLDDLRVWKEIISPEDFYFEGFRVVSAIEVTDQQVLSLLKRDLIEKESIISNERFEEIQRKLRDLFQRPDIVVGIAAFEGERIYVVNCGNRIKNGCIFSDSAHCVKSDFEGSVYERAVSARQTMVVEDLAKLPHPTDVEGRMRDEGVRNLIVAPLSCQGEIIGTLDIASPNPGDINQIEALKLNEVLPLFAVSIKQSMEALDGQVQAIIKEQCTAIHPSVEWRFRQAAYNFMEQRMADSSDEMEAIIFENVFPLYGVSDIRSSSLHRNRAISADLSEQLDLASTILEAAARAEQLPILEELAFRAAQARTSLGEDFNSRSEGSVLAFLKNVLEPKFTALSRLSGEVLEEVENYRRSLDPKLGFLYRQRRSFEEGVGRINDVIASYLDSAQEEAQRMFPHYFEKHKSDGIEHSIYIGPALVESGEFDSIYLQNLRIWQLIVMCEIARRTQQLKETLDIPLGTAHLVLVQEAPMSIRFRYDEKRFDVDGAYDIRYEILKKRIDKATIRTTGERVTAPGKVAVIYSSRREGEEYRRYAQFLHSAGFISSAVEELEIEPLQGVDGLKAIRFEVNSAVAVSTSRGEVSPADIVDTVRAF
jgi:putative methionine-R-sulfoxide reductase with GAF domain